MTRLWLHRYARWALGTAFLSAVASRLGLWGGGSFDKFLAYTADVLSFLPAVAIEPCAYAATVLELGFGVALVAGVRVHEVALASSVLLAIFGMAMAISFGIKSPLDYSVFSASAAAVLLAHGAPGDQRSLLARVRSRR